LPNYCSVKFFALKVIFNKPNTKQVALKNCISVPLTRATMSGIFGRSSAHSLE